jgi:hypothetical protein
VHFGVLQASYFFIHYLFVGQIAHSDPLPSLLRRRKGGARRRPWSGGERGEQGVGLGVEEKEGSGVSRPWSGGERGKQGICVCADFFGVTESNRGLLD